MDDKGTSSASIFTRCGFCGRHGWQDRQGRRVSERGELKLKWMAFAGGGDRTKSTGAINRCCNPWVGFKDVLRTMIDCGLVCSGPHSRPPRHEGVLYIDVSNKMRYTDDYMPPKYKLSNDWFTLSTVLKVQWWEKCGRWGKGLWVGGSVINTAELCVNKCDA